MTDYIAIWLAILIVISTYGIVKYVRPVELRPRPQWIILYACSLQAIWGTQLLFFGGERISAWTGFFWISPRTLGSLFLASSCLSYAGLSGRKGILWLMPQQGMMIVTAIGSITMIFLGHYADESPGDSHTRMFIFADQIPLILSTLWHTFAIYQRERDRIREDCSGVPTYNHVRVPTGL